MPVATYKEQNPPPLDRLNGLFRAGGLDLQAEVEKDTLFGRRGGARVSLNRLSDGERNSILLSASILTALRRFGSVRRRAVVRSGVSRRSICSTLYCRGPKRLASG